MNQPKLLLIAIALTFFAGLVVVAGQPPFEVLTARQANFAGLVLTTVSTCVWVAYGMRQSRGAGGTP
jgi:hypothetical protein